MIDPEYPNDCQRLEKQAMLNDPFERVAAAAQAIIRDTADEFEADAAEGVEGVTVSEGERLALRRAMARFLIDSGLASANGWA